MEGQFIVQYDVDLSSTGGNEIQVLDGYFVHYFAPEDLQTLPRHVVFVVDVSGSMSGTKIRQTKDALVTILDDMTEQDYFDIIAFSNGVSYWNMEKYDSLETTTPIRQDQKWTCAVCIQLPHNDLGSSEVPHVRPWLVGPVRSASR